MAFISKRFQTQDSLAERVKGILTTANPLSKAKMAQSLARDWFDGHIETVGKVELPDDPARPPKPRLCMPRDVPKRKINRGVMGRVNLLHALAHIELNAIDLAFDIIARFPEISLPRAFYDDWVRVGEDEARHFLMLEKRLKTLGSFYGALPAHDGLWSAARETRHNFLARLAIVPMVLEARGLDVTPAMIGKLKQADDVESARILQTIHDDEITHVAAGKRWYSFICQQNQLDEETTWQALVRAFFKGQLKRPFNYQSRTRAGLPRSFYDTIAMDEVV